MNFETWNGTRMYSAANFRWVADYSRHVAPDLTRNWCTRDTDELNTSQARQLGAELQRSVDDCSIDAYARQLFAKCWAENSVPDLARFKDLLGPELPKTEQERRLVNEFISAVQRFIAFLMKYDGFKML
jgi:hypothetical protein